MAGVHIARGYTRWQCSLCVIGCALIAACGGGGGGSSDSAGEPATVGAEAGSDQTVLELTTVILAGSGSGDGSLRYSWSQSGGESTVALSDADQATASFQSPDVEAGSPQTLVFQLQVTDGTGAVATDSVSVTIHETAPDVTVSGKVQYEFVPANSGCFGLDYSNIQLRPIRGATVQLLDAGTGALIASQAASGDGAYAFTVAGQRQVLVRVRAELKQSGSPAWDAEVRDNTANTSSPLASRPLYVLDSAAFNTGLTDRVLNLTATTGWDGAAYSGVRAAAPFAILDTAYAAMSLVLTADPAASFPPLDIFWSANNTTVQTAGRRIDLGEIGTTYYDPDDDSLFLLGKADDDTEEFDSHVIAHEWGHYFEDSFSRSDSLGGPHSLGARLDMRLAFGEGWATAFAGMALGSPDYCDTSGAGQQTGFGIDLENDRLGTAGWFNELSTMAILYDLWDSPLADDDTASLGFAPLFEVFADDQKVTPAFTSIFSFATALKTRNPDQALLIDTLLTTHDINGTDAYANDEHNDGGAQDALPVYTRIAPDGSTEQLCTNDDQDSSHDGNKLSIFRFLHVPVTTAGRYTIRVENVAPPSSPSGGPDCGDSTRSDPEFILYRVGQSIHQGTSCEANVEQATTGTLSVGDYAMTVSEYRYADENTPDSFPDRSCFDVTVSPAP